MGPGEGAAGTRQNTVLGCRGGGAFEAAAVYVDDQRLNVDAPVLLGLQSEVIVQKLLADGSVELAVLLFEFLV